jgi:MinD superfamily P-loop ATPase
MKEALVISGKGGTGKTTVSAALADILAANHNLVLVDADVDAANLELLMQPALEKQFDFLAGTTAVIDQSECISCGLCAQVCRFDAVKEDNGAYSIDPSFCEGCLSCTYQCPVDAISSHTQKSGEWYRSSTAYGTLFHAFLHPGAENSGKLVSTIKTAARDYALETGSDLMLIDGPPGIGCPVTAALQGSDLAVIVCEPTVSGVHDMRRVHQAASHFGIPCGIVINKYDLNQEMRMQIKQYAKENEISIIGEIPYDERILAAVCGGLPVTRANCDDLKIKFEMIAKQIIRILNK